MVMVDLMITAMRTYEACVMHAMLDAQGSREQLPCLPRNHED